MCQEEAGSARTKLQAPPDFKSECFSQVWTKIPHSRIVLFPYALYDLERLLGRINPIFEEANEIQKTVIACDILKKNRVWSGAATLDSVGSSCQFVKGS
jgi:hypothetical protein